MRPWLTRLLAALYVLCATAAPVSAHFSAGTKVRTILIAAEDGQLIAFVRSPAPLYFSDVVREAQVGQVSPDTDLLYPVQTSAGPRYRISLDEVAVNEAEFRERVAAALIWEQNGLPVTARLLDAHLLTYVPAEGFGTVADARASLAGEGAGIDPIFGDAAIEAAFVIDAPDPFGTIEVRSAYPEMPLLPDVTVENHIVDARVDPAVSIAVPGQLQDAATIDGSAWSAALEFTWQGVKHIIEGLDHVLLVVCLALGVGARMRLLWLATAFTLGHSVTLIGSFFGLAPDWPWFIPAVEAAIAASVLYAAIAAFRQSVGAVWVIAAIGLLHGFGFSFVLGEILGRDSPNLITALASFNVGIEIGQLAIIVVTLAVYEAVRRISANVVLPVRVAALGAIGIVSAVWVVERTIAVV